MENLLFLGVPILQHIRVCNFAITLVSTFLNNHKDLDPSYEMDLDFSDCLGRKILHLTTGEIQ